MYIMLGIDPKAWFIIDIYSCIQHYIEKQALQISSITFVFDFFLKFLFMSPF